MTVEQEVLEGNILIAEFMGAKKHRSAKEGGYYTFPDKIASYCPFLGLKPSPSGENFSFQLCAKKYFKIIEKRFV